MWRVPFNHASQLSWLASRVATKAWVRLRYIGTLAGMAGLAVSFSSLGISGQFGPTSITIGADLFGASLTTLGVFPWSPCLDHLLRAPSVFPPLPLAVYVDRRLASKGRSSGQFGLRRRCAANQIVDEVRVQLAHRPGRSGLLGSRHRSAG
jgi:hypothetical protein